MSSSSSSSSSSTWVYDVFPSFRGEDVRKTFLSHFYEEFDRKLIRVFKDETIKTGESLDPVLKKAIKDSRIAIVVFSKNYASSGWCLDELLEIVKCKEELCQIVIPVFYHLDPSHVRHQKGYFGEIFEKTCRRKTEDEIQLWREALTNVANIVGYHSQEWKTEAIMIQVIANDVVGKLRVLRSSLRGKDKIGSHLIIARMKKSKSEQLAMEGAANAFHQLADTMNRSPNMSVNQFYEACSRLRELFSFLDECFKSTETYYVAKIDDLAKASRSISTLEEMIDKDIEAGSVTDCGSHTNNLLKLKRGLELIKVMCEEILVTEGDSSIKDAAIKAYNDVLKPYVHKRSRDRACVKELDSSIPKRSSVLDYIGETEKSIQIHMQRYVTASAQVIEYLDNLFDSKDIAIDW